MRSKYFILTIIITFSLAFCKRENNDYLSDGIILGPDIRMCICCGGWYIEIGSATYEFDSLPDASNINLQQETFPVRVKLGWQLSDKAACPDKRIMINWIRKE